MDFTKLLILDGGMGSVLLDKGIKFRCCEELNLTHPEVIQKVHEEYIEAGANIITTNTFIANRNCLRNHNLTNVQEINEAAVRIAKAASNEKTLIAGSMGPLGEYMEPIGKLSFEQAYELYSEQARALQNVDLILIETISDIRIAKAAVLAAKDNTTLPIICSMTFEKNGRTPTGTDVETAINILESMGVQAVGLNCSCGPDELFHSIKKATETATIPIIAYPNAATPELIEGKTQYNINADSFADYAENIVKLGVNIIGGCCGTTPDHIRKLKQKNLQLTTRNVRKQTKISSRTKTVAFNKPLIIGERINPTARKDLQQNLLQKRYSAIRQEAIMQNKADILDVNCGVPGINEPEAMKEVILSIQDAVDKPLMIDSSNKDAIEAGLRVCNGKPIINSCTGETESMEAIFKLAKRYGAAVLGLTLNKSIPKTSDERYQIAQRIIAYGSQFIPKEDILIDCLISTVSAEQDRALVTLNTLEKVKRIGVKTILGVSNVSYGLPNRSAINSSFLTLALSRGLDAAIMNPNDKNMVGAIKATNVLTLSDQNALDFIAEFNDTIIKKVDHTKPIEQRLEDSIIFGDSTDIVKLIDKALETYEPLQINDILIEALKTISRDFKLKKIYLPQVMMSADTMKKAFAYLKTKFHNGDNKARGKILFATVEGDVHDIGKNIVISLLETYNYKIIDLGKDIPADEILEATKQYSPHIVCLSALMTTTVKEMDNVIRQLRLNNIQVPVMVGGAVVNEEYAQSINAEYAKDGIAAIKEISRLIQ